MPFVLAFMLLLLAQGIARAASDEIDSFVKGFNGMSLNGEWPIIDLPGDAPVEKVVEAFVKTEKKTTEAAQFNAYQISETKKIVLPGSELTGWTVVLVSSSRGSKTILLLRNAGRGWLVRPYFITTAP